VVRTDSSEVGTVIEETAIKELPLNGRNFATLVYLVPGITPGQANENLSGTSTFNPRGASNFNALRDHAVSGRVDHRFTDDDSVFVRFNYGKFRLDAPQGQANCCLPTPADAAARFDLGPFIAGIQNTKLTTHGAAFNYTKVLSPTFVNELRVGYAKTEPFTTQSDYGHRSADSLGIRGINVSDITTGLPNIDITNFTGISGGPAFLPVNPAQFHYQVEDALVWLKGRHQVKFGYRIIDRAPSPMIHDNTRSNITFNNNFVNNPVTNTGGTGLAAVLLGYYNTASRGFLLEEPRFKVVEQAAFVQDDYGKSLDYGSSAASGGGAVGGGQTITDMDAWHGPSGYDTRHRAVISHVSELPLVKAAAG
jgi:hypothetical protein